MSDYKEVVDIKHEILKHTLDLYNSSIPRSVVQTFVDKVAKIIAETYVPFLKQEVRKKLKHYPKLILDEISMVFEKNKYPFEAVATEHLRFELYRKKALYADPIEYVVGQIKMRKKCKFGIIRQSVFVKGIHIPLVATLKTFFDLPGVLNETLNYLEFLENENQIFSNFVQGSLWKNRPRINDRLELPIFLFFNDFETGKALGSHAGKNKLGAIYASIPCLPPYLVAKIKCIFLVLLFRSKHRTLFKNYAILKPLLLELKHLFEQGIKFSINGTERIVYFRLCLVIGDNLGLNSIFGFVESFSAKYFCRLCHVLSSVSKSLTKEDPTLLRTKESYDKDLKLGDTSSTGIKTKCCFNNIASFHVATNKSVDIMHDIFEGVACYVLVKILNQLIYIDKCFTLELLNERIDCFDYGDIEISNKPMPIAEQHLKSKQKLRMSAAEMACFVRYLGVMLGDLISRESETWNLYLKFRQIVDLVTAPKLLRSDAYRLKELIEEHHLLYIKLFGHLTPKFHNMTHYPEILLSSGPLVHQWSMRFESKNKELKQTATSTQCQKNILKTIAVKHQLLMAQLNYSSMIAENVKVGPREMSFRAHCLFNQICVTFVEVEGVKYKSGTVILKEITEDLPVFAKIDKIYVLNDEIKFMMTILKTIAFDSHYHAYFISKSESSTLLKDLKYMGTMIPCLLTEKKLVYMFRLDMRSN